MIATSGPLKYRGGMKYVIAEDWWCMTPLVGCAARLEDPDDPALPWVELSTNGALKIKEGWCYDGASGPTIDTKSSMRGALAHDALYALERAGKLPEDWREQCDDLLVALCVQDGMWGWRARLWYWGVRKFAGFAAARQDEKVEVAP